MRNLQADVRHRGELRRHYFEDPNYRMWSSIAPETTRRFAHSRDDVLFCYYLSGSDAGLLTGSEIKQFLNDGHNLPINWHNLYAYFDARANDEECIYRKSITEKQFLDIELGFSTQQSIMDILDEYRDKLLKTDYDMI